MYKWGHDWAFPAGGGNTLTRIVSVRLRVEMCLFLQRFGPKIGMCLHLVPPARTSIAPEYVSWGPPPIVPQ